LDGTSPATPQAIGGVGATSRRVDADQERTAMKVWKLRISRRAVALAAVLVGMVSLAIGAHAAMNTGALEAAKPIATEQESDPAQQSSKVALVIGNGHYPTPACR
jgi:hypothetical protein